MMEKSKHTSSLFTWVIAISVLSLVFLPSSNQLQSSQAQTLLRIQRLMDFPGALSNWTNLTDFCNDQPSSSVTVVCYENSITQLHITGNKGSPSLNHSKHFTVSAQTLPQTFSVDSFLTTLAGLPSLKVLSLVSLGLWGPLPGKISRLSSLEILNISSNFFYGAIPPEVSLLRSLETLILDDNLFTGTVPEWLSALPVLAVLSLKNNSLSGSLPSSLKTLENLRILALSGNRLCGEVPDLSSLSSLQVLDLGDNYLGPQFPMMGNKLVTLLLRNNSFSSGIPSEIGSYYQLQRLDVSFNRLAGPFPTLLFSLPMIRYLNIASNKLTGTLSENMSCNAALDFVDLSLNLLTGSLPRCLVSNSQRKVVWYARNCLATNAQRQRRYVFCRNEALAVEVSPRTHKRKSAGKVVLGVLGGLVGGIAMLGLLTIVILRRRNASKLMKNPPQRLITENASTGYSSKLLSDARYISQTMMLGGMGGMGLQPYRKFTLEELEEATNNFEMPMFMGDGYLGQMYRGTLNDGSLVAIRCLKLKGQHSPENFIHRIELIAKLRHRHLVSVLGHCLECYLDDSSVSRIFFVFEYVPNATLRGSLSEGVTGHTLTWTHRIAAAIGVAKGIQFLHTGIVPGIFGNNLKITNILLDQNFVAKIISYDLPVVADIRISEVGTGVSLSGTRDYNALGRTKLGEKVDITKLAEKIDVYDFGVVLLEIIIGRPITSQTELNLAKDQVGLAADHAARRSVVDSAVFSSCAEESLKTVMEISTKCLSNEPTKRPSVEDVLWNLQFAAQVQDAWSDSQGGDGSPASPSQQPKTQLAYQ